MALHRLKERHCRHVERVALKRVHGHIVEPYLINGRRTQRDRSLLERTVIRRHHQLAVAVGAQSQSVRRQGQRRGRLHAQIDQYLANGIEVRYLMYPRSGPASPAWTTAEQVWCASDQQNALTMAKLDQEFPTNECDATMIQNHYVIGRDAGLSGTPAERRLLERRRERLR